MKDLAVYRKLFLDVKKRVEEHGYNVETKFDNERSAVRIVRRKDDKTIFQVVEEVKGDEHPRNSQLKAYFFFISYLMFYGVFTVSHSFDQEEKEKNEKKKEKK